MRVMIKRRCRKAIPIPLFRGPPLLLSSDVRHWEAFLVGLSTSTISFMSSIRCEVQIGQVACLQSLNDPGTHGIGTDRGQSYYLSCSRVRAIRMSGIYLDHWLKGSWVHTINVATGWSKMWRMKTIICSTLLRIASSMYPTPRLETSGASTPHTTTLTV